MKKNQKETIRSQLWSLYYESGIFHRWNFYDFVEELVAILKSPDATTPIPTKRRGKEQQLFLSI